jgi:hypothetical protein
MSSDCAVLPASNETGFINEPAISRPQGTQTIRERGFTEQTIEVRVDDRVYCMQDKYELPYTTVDQDGNTVVSVVDRIESHFPSENDWRATMRLKVFKNQTIKVTPEVTAAAQARYPTSSTFLDATMTSLEYNRRDDRNLGEVYRAAMRWSRTSCTNSVTAINYTAYTDETDTSVTSVTGYRTGSAAARCVAAGAARAAEGSTCAGRGLTHAGGCCSECGTGVPPPQDAAAARRMRDGGECPVSWGRRDREAQAPGRRRGESLPQRGQRDNRHAETP